MAALPVSAVPQSPEGFYAVNNQFLVSGPKGLMEFKMLENEDTYIRFDLPGDPENGVMSFIDESKKTITICAYAPKEHRHDGSHRIYGTCFKPKLKIGRTKTQLICKCHDISSFTSHMSDGVLRLIATKTHAATQCPCFYPTLSGHTLMPHVGVYEGSPMAYESKQLPDGKLYVRVDMPGVPKENFTVSVTNGRVKVTGEAPARDHDSAGRFYSGDVAVLSALVDIPSRRVKTIAKNGVLRLLIPRV
ncbi:hypothetical protein CARUB_v10006396mg [Capsella rubella]|uniref:SHSP domain-containing protein n=1 Tax=Capsella rubella TaxID=81985 RepID=R0F222_9BRAS|nr:hypothetical protein CARUB_v10006396mg [Capsella rubella]